MNMIKFRMIPHLKCGVIIIIINFLLVFTAPFSTQAQSKFENMNQEYIDSNKVLVLSEQDVVDMGLEYNRKLKSYNTKVEIAEYRYESAGQIQNPELRFSDVSSRYFTQEFDEMELGLRWNFPGLGELGEKKQQAQVNIWERKVLQIRYQQQLVSRIRRNYANVLMYDDLAELVQERISKENERLKVIEILVELGERSIVYLTKAKMWHAEAMNNYARAIQKKNLERRELANRSGIPEHAEFIFVDLPEIVLDIDELINLAIVNRPEIKLVQQRIDLAVLQNDYELHKRIPWFSFAELSYHKEKNSDKDWGELKMGMSLPIFNWNTGNIKATDLAVKNKEDEFEAIRESIDDEVRLAYTVYKDLLLDWNNFQLYADEIISNTQTIVNQAKEHKVLMPDEVLEMELTIIETKKLLCEKRRNLAHAIIDLYYAIGIENNEQL